MPVACVSALIVPFNIAYSQMATTFKVQGIVMNSALGGFLDTATMNNLDAISVLVCGYLVGNFLYPALQSGGIKIPITCKFAMGSFCGALAMISALFTEYRIHSTFANSGKQISILWQTFSYVSVGCGEIFAISSAYEFAYTAAPRDSKAFASATNLFFVGGLPNLLCIALFHICEDWFHTKDGKQSIQSINDYATAQVYKYFLVLLFIALFGTIINLLPPVQRWIDSTTSSATSVESKGNISEEATSYKQWLRRQYTRKETGEASIN